MKDVILSDMFLDGYVDRDFGNRFIPTDDKWLRALTPDPSTPKNSYEALRTVESALRYLEVTENNRDNTYCHIATYVPFWHASRILLGDMAAEVSNDAKAKWDKWLDKQWVVEEAPGYGHGV